jgi:hypothetical protein
VESKSKICETKVDEVAMLVNILILSGVGASLLSYYTHRRIGEMTKKQEHLIEFMSSQITQMKVELYHSNDTEMLSAGIPKKESSPK